MATKRKPAKAKSARPAVDEMDNRAVVPEAYDRRVCVHAPMPVCCPRCRSSRTTMANGVHYNLHFAVRYEHRVCGACGFAFTATRRMTAEELDARR